MNLLLLERGEIDAFGIAVLSADDTRARHVREVLRLPVGGTLRAGIPDGSIGVAEIRGLAPKLVLAFRPTVPLPPRPRVDVLLAMPRPKVLHRLWSPLAQMGVGEIQILHAHKSERAYFSTHVLEPASIRAGLLEGLAQARDTRVPRVRVCHSLREALAATPPTAHALRLVAHPGEAADWRPAVRALPPGARIFLAVGPEGGWTPRELDALRAAAFLPFSLGFRILRTDVALVALLSRIACALADAGTEAHGGSAIRF